MSDLVERLRRRRDQEAVGCANLPIVGYTGDGRLLGDAADALEQKGAEIERLRAAARAFEEGLSSDCDGPERDALRAALGQRGAADV